MLPEPRGNFSTIGDKVCRELVHFQFARVGKDGYVLTESGKGILELLNERRFLELRRAMICAHLATYDNLRAVVQRHIEVGSIWRCTLAEGEKLNKPNYLEKLLEPTFGQRTAEKAAQIRAQGPMTAKRTEDAINQAVINEIFTDFEYSVTLFRALCDRLVSLRLINMMRVMDDSCDFTKSYSPCVSVDPPRPWYRELDIPLSSSSTYKVFLCEPDLNDQETLKLILNGIEEAFQNLDTTAGYYDLPSVRDFTCEHLRIPEAAFDEGVNSLLDQTPPPLSPGLRYEGISARRKPLLRTKATGQIHNLIRRA